MAKEKAPATEARLDDAHMRIDEIDRVLMAVRDAIKPEVLAALLAAAMGTVDIQRRCDKEEILAAITRDLAADAKVAESNAELITWVRELVKVMCMPVTRTSRINLPTGPVELTVRETRGE